MTSHSAVLLLVLAMGGAAAVAGCAGTGEGMSRRPAMPTVTPPATVAPLKIDAEAVVAAALQRIRSKDWVAARRQLEAVPDSLQRAELSAEVVKRLIPGEIGLAAAFAAELAAGSGQSGGVEMVAEAWVGREPDAALSWAHGVPEPATAAVVRRAVARHLVQAGPRAALERIAALPAGVARDDLLGFAAAAWARIEPDAAVAWVRGLPADAARERLTSSVGFEIAQKSPDRALELAGTLPEGRNRWLLVSAIAQTWVATDPKAALAWAGRLPAGEARAAAFAGLDTGLGVPTARRSANAPGARTIRSRGFGGGVADAALSAGASADFAAWLETQPGGRSRDEAIVEFVQQRGATDSGAIGQWLTTLPPGAARDRAMEIYLEGQLIGAPQRAASWLRSLPRSDRSDEMTERTARAWLQTNPDAAAAWLLETQLPPDRKERLLREAGR